jgi:hypothetical protein
MAHRWNDPNRDDLNYTYRTCKKCQVVQITRHEPDNWPETSWKEWDIPGKPRYASTKVPPCTGEKA